MTAPENPRVCPKGHKYFKSTDCPTCPVCEAAKVKAGGGFLSEIGAPAYRALKRAKRTTLKKLSGASEKELLALHGFGPSTLPPLRAALKRAGLAFRDDSVSRVPAKRAAKKTIPKKKTAKKKTAKKAPGKSA